MLIEILEAILLFRSPPISHLLLADNPKPMFWLLLILDLAIFDGGLPFSFGWPLHPPLGHLFHPWFLRLLRHLQDVGVLVGVMNTFNSLNSYFFWVYLYSNTTYSLHTFDRYLSLFLHCFHSVSSNCRTPLSYILYHYSRYLVHKASTIWSILFNKVEIVM